MKQIPAFHSFAKMEDWLQSDSKMFMSVRERLQFTVSFDHPVVEELSALVGGHKRQAIVFWNFVQNFNVALI